MNGDKKPLNKRLDSFIFEKLEFPKLFSLEDSFFDPESRLAVEPADFAANLTFETTLSNNRSEIKSALLSLKEKTLDPSSPSLFFLLGLSDFDVERLPESLSSLSAKKIKNRLLFELSAELKFFLSNFSLASSSPETYASLSALDFLLEKSLSSLEDREETLSSLLNESRSAFRAESIEKKSRPFYERIRVTDDDTFAQIYSLANECRLAAFS